jgi:SAM-dependent methyltransferase
MAGDSSNDGWGERAEAWSRHWARLADPARVAVADATRIGPGIKVLDAGCGTGEFLALAARRGALTAGIDASPGMLALARRRAPAADLREGDITALPYADRAFDVVTAFNAVQFTGDVPATIAELARVAPVVAVCNWADGSELLALFAALSDERPAPRAPLEEHVRAAGLEPTLAADVDTPYETGDIVAALRDGSGITGDIEAAAAPYRRPDGSYGFRNRFRYVVATRS